SGAEGLARPLREVLTQRLHQGTPIWLAGYVDMPGLTSQLLTLAGPFGKELQPLAKVQAFGVGLRPETDTVTLVGSFECVDPQSAGAGGSSRREREKGFKDLKVAGGRDEPQGQDRWLTVQLRVTAETMRDWLTQAGTALPGMPKRP